MKKFLIASVFALSSVAAVAGIPAGYELSPEGSNETTKTFVNKSNGAMISLTVSNQQMPAEAAAQEVAKQYNCTDKVTGTDEAASIDECPVNGMVFNFAFFSGDGKTLMVMANDKATDDEVKEIFAD